MTNLSQPNQWIYVVSRKELFDLALSIPKAIMQRCVRVLKRRQNPEIQKQNIIEFYKKNRLKPKEVDLVDVGSGQLMPMVTDVINNFANNHQHFIDIGCGDASLTEIPVIKTSKYTGVDLVINNNLNSENIDLIEEQITGQLKINGKLKPRFFVCVHLACYMEDFHELVQFLQLNSSAGDHILLIEPNRMPFWETQFDGINIYLRSRKMLNIAMINSGFSLDFEGGLYCSQIMGMPIIEVSSMQVFKRL